MTGALLGHVVLGMLVFARLAGLVMTMPGFSSQVVPALARLAAAVPLTLVLYPAVEGTALPTTISALVAAVVGEALLGVAMGFAITLAFNALAIGAETIGAQSGLAIAAMFDPVTMSSPSVVGLFATWLGTGVFFGADLHLHCVAALGDSLRTAPPGAVATVLTAGSVLVPLAGTAIVTGIQLAGPLTLFVFTVNLGLSLLGRMAPNMHLFFAIGPTVTVAAGLALLAVALPVFLGTWYAFLPRGLDALRALGALG